MTREQRALVRIVKLCRRPNHRISRQIRLMELALEGLGVPTNARNAEIQKVLQERREVALQHVAARQIGGSSEAA